MPEKIKCYSFNHKASICPHPQNENTFKNDILNQWTGSRYRSHNGPEKNAFF
jgi:hypothetical protein